MELTILKSDGDLLCRRCVLADTPLSRLRGLMWRKRLADDEGMLFATWSIHTSFMRFPIDVLFLDRGLGVRRVVHGLKPWRAATDWRAHAVVELPAGTARRAGIETGEQLSFVAQPNAVPNGSAPQPDLIAIASSDSRFLRVSGFLLERHGFRVETFRKAGDVIPRAAEGRFAAVIVDGSGSLVSAARVIRGLSAESPSTGVVLVGDGAADDGSEAVQPHSLRMVPKWDSFEQLVQEIRSAASERRGYELA